MFFLEKRTTKMNMVLRTINNGKNLQRKGCGLNSHK